MTDGHIKTPKELGLEEKIPTPDVCAEAEEWLDAAKEQEGVHNFGKAPELITQLVEEVGKHDRANRTSRNLLGLSQGNYEQLKSQLTRMQEMYEAECGGSKKLLDQLAEKDNALEEIRNRTVHFEGDEYAFALNKNSVDEINQIAEQALGPEGGK